MSQSQNKQQIIIGLTNPKSPTNVGAVMRAAGCFQASQVRYSGQRYTNAAKFSTDTKNVRRDIPLVAVDSLLDGISDDVALVCIELVEGATPLPDFEHPANAYYIFGPEDGSLSQQVVNQAEHVVYVPTIGCLNLAATVNVVLYDRLAKSSESIASDELIRNSRDTNNKVRVTLS
ncbi:RNA methyltransferase [Thalassotalea sp. G2M2-11]|uniref:TrmH family RNA methyltransferase n=1 Tax=Thalassotalea sp. G2M2-11 TaxID=2787627 RepID=UPI0019D08AC1